MAELSASSCDIWDIAAAFMNFEALDTGIVLTSEDERTPTSEGSYFLAALLYGKIFGKSAYGMDILGPYVSAEDAEILQAEAHRAVFGAEPQERAQSRVQTAPQPEYIDPRFENEEISENARILIASALAYERRGIWIQYDQAALDRATYSYSRRTLIHGEPEQASPQRNLYLDCSSFISSLYQTAFGYDFEGRPRSTNLYGMKSVEAWQWDADNSNLNPSEAAEEFLDNLEPGDCVIYTDFANIGHSMLYIGNGTLLHCAVRHLCGFSPDYFYDNGVESTEIMPGGIIRDNVDVLVNPVAPRYIFTQTVFFKILRPLSLNLTPTPAAILRAGELDGVFAYEETSAPDSVYTEPGSTVSFTLCIENNSSEDKTFSIEKRLGEYLDVLSGAESENGCAVLSARVKAGKTAKLSYSLSVSADAPIGELINSPVILSGLPLNDTPIRVGKTPKNVPASVPAAPDSLQMVKKYCAAAGVSLPFDTREQLSADLLTFGGKNEFCFFSMPDENNEALREILAFDLFGGKYFASLGGFKGNRSENMLRENLMPGDIICYCPNAKPANMQFAIFDGENIVIREQGVPEALSGSAQKVFLEGLFGEYFFFVLRPLCV